MAKKGLIARLIDGPERSETYARSTLPTNRWELGWDVFKTNLGKLFGLNWLTLVFIIPFFLLLGLRYLNKVDMVSYYPFAQNVSGGYPFFPSTIGLESQMNFALNRQIALFIIVAVLIGSVGISGGFHVMRNMIWAEGVMIGADFWKGVKQNYFVVMFSLLLYSVVMVLSILSVNMASVLIDTHEGIEWLLITMQVISYILMGFITVMTMYMITLGVTYKLKFRNLIRNAFILTIALLPVNIFFAAFASVFFLLIMSGVNLLVMIGVVMVAIWGVSLFMLIWTNYSQWVFDKYVNDKVPGAKKNRGIYKPVGADEDKGGEDLIIEKSKFASKPVKPITDYDVELYELPETFSRKDLQKLEETKEAMRRDSDQYAEEHSADAEVKKPETFEDLLEEEKKSDSENN